MKKLKIVGILVVLFILCSLVVTVQAGAKVSAPEVEWDKTFGGTGWDLANSVQQTSDGGYILAGGTNPYGAGLCDFWLVKTDSTGNKLWDKTFGGYSGDKAYSVQQTSDGGYILAGETISYGAGLGDFWLVKTDSRGNKLWDKTFGGTNWDLANSVQQTSDGGYILAGSTRSYGAGHDDIWLVKTDSTGNKLWDKTFGGTYWDDASSVQQTSDGGYILAGDWLVKTDSHGNKLWDKTFGGTDRRDEAYSVQQTSDGGYILAGETYSYGAGTYDIWLVKTDSNGNKLWDKTFGGTGKEYAYSVQQTSDGGYILAGETESYGAGSSDFWLVKTDSTGNKLWDKTFGGTEGDLARSVQQTSDGGYIVTGYTKSYGAGAADFWLIKVKGEPGEEEYNAKTITTEKTVEEKTTSAPEMCSEGEEITVVGACTVDELTIEVQDNGDAVVSAKYSLPLWESFYTGLTGFLFGKEKQIEDVIETKLAIGVSSLKIEKDGRASFIINDYVGTVDREDGTWYCTKFYYSDDACNKLNLGNVSIISPDGFIYEFDGKLPNIKHKHLVDGEILAKLYLEAKYAKEIYKVIEPLYFQNTHLMKGAGPFMEKIYLKLGTMIVTSPVPYSEFTVLNDLNDLATNMEGTMKPWDTALDYMVQIAESTNRFSWNTRGGGPQIGWNIKDMSALKEEEIDLIYSIATNPEKCDESRKLLIENLEKQTKKLKQIKGSAYDISISKSDSPGQEKAKEYLNGILKNARDLANTDYTFINQALITLKEEE